MSTAVILIQAAAGELDAQHSTAFPHLSFHLTWQLN